ncbi:MAG TPA: DNA repair exonuclease [Planctomycetaceae bacterium]|nr:DNA repair exonuclease [Planctomycetaceae bacterium]
MKFLHAADVHLDSPLDGLERYEGAPVEQLRGATRHALRNLVELAIQQRVDFVIIAGDVYDGDWRDYNTGLFFAGQMAELSRAGIPVFVIKGNHDAASQVSKALSLPDKAHVFSHNRPETVRLKELEVALHGQSYAERSVTDDLSRNYPAPVPGWFNIGVLHTSATGREGHENYAPCTIEGLRAKGYDYWALGHVHQREVLCEDPWIVFPGNIQGRHIRETGRKGCTIVTVERGTITQVLHHDLDVLRWGELVIDLTGTRDFDAALARTGQALAAHIDASDDLPWALRLRCTGITAAHAGLILKREQFVAECRARAADLSANTVWIEKVKLQTRAPAAESSRLDDRADAVGDLLRYLRDASTNESLLTDLAGDLADLNQKLPSDLNDGPEPLRLDQPATIAAMLPEVEALLTSRLLNQEAN